MWRIADPLSALWRQQHRYLELLWGATFRTGTSLAYFCSEFEQHRELEIEALFPALQRRCPTLEEPLGQLVRASTRLAWCARRVCTMSQRELLGQALRAQSRREEELLRPHLIPMTARRQLPRAGALAALQGGWPHRLPGRGPYA